MFKKKEEKYLFVKSEDIKRSAYEIKREFSYNDYDNVYYQTGYESIDTIFNENGVPKEYQKVILEFRNGLLTTNKEIEELLTKTKFILTNKTDDNIIYGNTENNILSKAMFFKSQANLVNYDEVLSFIQELSSHRLIDNYLHSLLLFFRKESYIKIKNGSKIKIKKHK